MSIIKTKLPLQFCINSLTIMIGKLWLVELTNSKTRKKNVNKQYSRPFVNKISIMVCYFIGQLNKP